MTNNETEAKGGEIYEIAQRFIDQAQYSWEPSRRRGKTRKGKRSQVRANLQVHVGGGR